MVRRESGLRTASASALSFASHSPRPSSPTHPTPAAPAAPLAQQQVGHEHSSTTEIYTSVSSDYKTRALRAALDRIVAGATERRS